MALRNYMQDLIRAQYLCDTTGKENGIVNITIVDDNSSSSLDDDDIYNNDSEHDGSTTIGNQSFLDKAKTNCIDRGKSHSDIGSCTSPSNRIMLKEFQRRQRFLRETLSPILQRQSVSKTAGPLDQFSPLPISN